MKKIGIIGGISHYSTLEYYRRIMDICRNEFTDCIYPEVIIYSLSFDKFKAYEDSGDKENYIKYIGEGIQGLRNSGAEVYALAANSPHSVIDELENIYNVKFVSALQSALHEARRNGIKRSLLLGIKYTMQSTYYQEYFRKNGIDMVTPELDEQELLNDIIFNEFVPGEKINSKSLEILKNIISNNPTDGVILGCMRLPVFFNKLMVTDINLVDVLECHVRDIINIAIKE